MSLHERSHRFSWTLLAATISIFTGLLGGVALGSSWGFGTALSTFFALQLLQSTSQKRLLTLHRVASAENGEQTGILGLLQNLAETLDLPQPKLAIAPEMARYSFVTGRSIYDSTIVVSRGLITQLADSELQALLTLHYLEIREGRFELTGPLAVLGEMFAIHSNLSYLKFFLGYPLLVTVAAFVRRRFSARHELALDQSAIRLGSTGENLANALRKIHILAGEQQFPLSGPYTDLLYRTNPREIFDWTALGVSVPTTGARINALMRS